MKPVFSVIIPAYNAEDYIEECIASVLEQHFSKFEVIIVDDGSVDKTLQICRQYAQVDSRIKVIHKVNGGETAARYDAIKVAEGDYVCCVDSDDWIEPSLLEDATAIIEKYKPDTIVYGFKEENRKGKCMESISCRKGFYSKKDLESKIYPWLIQSADVRYFHPSVWGAFFKKELFEKNMINNRHAVFGGDQTVAIPCFANANSMYSMEDCYYNYRYNAASVTKSGKVYDWECPYVINKNISSKIDINRYDFKQQLYRKIVHDFWTTACSQFNDERPYNEVKQDILDHLRLKYIQVALKNADFTSWKGRLILNALRHKDVQATCLCNKVRKL